MTLIKSISGIRGTIGGSTGDTLNPLDIVKFTTAYATFIRRHTENGSGKIVVGRDARMSGQMVESIVCGTLVGMGFDVLNIGLATTPTTELAVTMAKADGGIIITASHNPRQWNALKLLNAKGEFLTKDDGNEVLDIADSENFEYADVDNLGKIVDDDSFDDRHVEAVLKLQLVDEEAIRKAGFKVCVDSINSVGGVILPKLLDRLGVEYKFLNAEPTGDFAHNPEPLEKNLTGIMDEMKSGEYDLGIVVDPDVDRLAFICEDGRMFGEEYTLVSVADYVLAHTPGNTVSNLSSTRALRDVVEVDDRAELPGLPEFLVRRVIRREHDVFADVADLLRKDQLRHRRAVTADVKLLQELHQIRIRRSLHGEVLAEPLVPRKRLLEALRVVTNRLRIIDVERRRPLRRNLLEFGLVKG